MQDAYAAESGTFAGDWTTIGYSMPVSSNFEYTEEGGATFTAATGSKVATLDFVAAAGPFLGWQGKNKVALNDYVVGSVWKISFAQNTSVKGTLLYTPDITGTNASDCELLTPNFKKLGGN